MLFQAKLLRISKQLDETPAMHQLQLAEVSGSLDKAFPASLPPREAYRKHVRWEEEDGEMVSRPSTPGQNRQVADPLGECPARHRQGVEESRLFECYEVDGVKPGGILHADAKDPSVARRLLLISVGGGGDGTGVKVVFSNMFIILLTRARVYTEKFMENNAKISPVLSFL